MDPYFDPETDIDGLDSVNEFDTEDLFGDEQNKATLKVCDENTSRYYEFSFRKDPFVEGEEVFLCLEKYNFKGSIPMDIVDNVYYQTLLLENEKEHKYYFLVGEEKVLLEDKPKTEDGLHNVVKIGENSNPIHIYPQEQDYDTSQVDFKKLVEPENLRVYLKEDVKEKLKLVGKQEGEENDFPFSHLQKLEFLMEEGSSEDIKFIVDLPQVTTLDTIELSPSFEDPRCILEDNLENNYFVTIEYHTLENEWKILYENKLLGQLLPLSHKTRINSPVRAQKIRVSIHKKKNESFDPNKITRIQKSFIYEGQDFKNPGVLHWIGTNYGTSPYKNPASTSRVKLIGPGEVDPYAISYVDFKNYGMSEVSPIIHETPYFIVDLGEDIRVKATAYSLRHGSTTLYSLIADWIFQGSNDMQKWDDLHSHYITPYKENDNTVSFNTRSNSGWYRYFRIFMHGESGYLGSGPDGSTQLLLGGLEIYGAVNMKYNAPIDSTLNSISLDVSTYGFRRTGYLKEYVYDKVPDNGLLHHLGWDEDSNTYSNPVQSGKIKIELPPHEAGLSLFNKHLIVDFDSYLEYNIGTGIEPIWFYVDLGEENKIKVSSFTLRHGSSLNNNFIQNFRLDASNDAKKWTTLFKEPGCPWNTSNEISNFTVESCSKFYRFLRILQVGNSSSGYPSFSISGMEVFGKVQNDPILSDSLYNHQQMRIIAHELSINEKFFLESLNSFRKNENRDLNVKFLSHLIQLNSSYLKLIPETDIDTFLIHGIIKGDDEDLVNLSVMILHHSDTELVYKAILKALPTLKDDIALPLSLEHFFGLIRRYDNPQTLSKDLIKTLLETGRNFNSSYIPLYSDLNEVIENRELYLELFPFAECNDKRDEIEDQKKDETEDHKNDEEKIVNLLSKNIESLKQNIASIKATDMSKDAKVLETYADNGNRLRREISALTRKLRKLSPDHPLASLKENNLSKLSSLCVYILDFLLEIEPTDLSPETILEISNVFVYDGPQDMVDNALIFLSKVLYISPDLPIHLFSSFLETGNTSSKAVSDIESRVKMLVSSDNFPLHYSLEGFIKKLREQLNSPQGIGTLDITLRIIMGLIPQTQTPEEKSSEKEEDHNTALDVFLNGSSKSEKDGKEEEDDTPKEGASEEKEGTRKKTALGEEMISPLKNLFTLLVEVLMRSLETNTQNSYYFAFKMISKIYKLPIEMEHGLFCDLASTSNNLESLILKVLSADTYYQSITLSFLDAFFRYRKGIRQADREVFVAICKKAFLETEEEQKKIFLIELLSILTVEENDENGEGLPHYLLEDIREPLFKFAGDHFNGMKENIKSWNNILRICANVNPFELYSSGNLEELCTRIFNGELFVRAFLCNSFHTLLVHLHKTPEIKDSVTQIVSKAFFTAANFDDMDGLSSKTIDFITDDIPNIVVEVSDIVKMLKESISKIPYSSFQVFKYDGVDALFTSVQIIDLCDTLLGTERYKEKHIEFNRCSDTIKLVKLIMDTMLKLKDTSSGNHIQNGKPVTTLIRDSLMGFLKYLLKEPESSKEVFNTISKSLQTVFAYKPLSKLFFKLIEDETFCKSYMIESKGHQILIDSISSLASRSAPERACNDGDIDISKTTVNDDGLVLYSKLIKNFKAPKGQYSSTISSSFKRLMATQSLSYTPSIDEYFLSTHDRSIPVTFEWGTLFLLKEVFFSFVMTNIRNTDNLTLVENGKILIEAGLTEETLKPVELIFPGNKETYTVKIKEPILVKIMRITFHPTVNKYYLTLYDLKIWGKRNLLPDKEGEITYSRSFMTNLLKFMTVAFSNNDVLDFILALPNIETILSHLLSLLPEESVTNIILRLVAKSKKLGAQTLDSLLLTDMKVPQFFGNVCSITNDDSFIQRLKNKIFKNTDKPRKLLNMVSALTHTLHEKHSYSSNTEVKLEEEELTVFFTILRDPHIELSVKKKIIELITCFAMRQESIVSFVLKNVEIDNDGSSENVVNVILLLSLSSISATHSKMTCESKPLYNTISKRVTDPKFSLTVLPHVLTTCIQPLARKYITEHLSEALWKIVQDKSFSSDLRDLSLKIIQRATLHEIDEFKEKCDDIILSSLTNSVENPAVAIKVLSSLKEGSINLIPFDYGTTVSNTVEHQLTLLEEDSYVKLSDDNTVVLSQELYHKLILFSPPISTEGITRVGFEILNTSNGQVEIGISEVDEEHGRKNSYMYNGRDFTIYPRNGVAKVLRDFGKPVTDGQIIIFQIDNFLRTLEVFVDGESLGVAGELPTVRDKPFYPHTVISNKDSLRISSYTTSRNSKKLGHESSYLRGRELVSYPLASSLKEFKAKVCGTNTPKQDIIFYDLEGVEINETTLIKDLKKDTDSDIIDLKYKFVDEPSPLTVKEVNPENYFVYNHLIKWNNAVTKVFGFIKTLIDSVETREDVKENSKTRWRFYYDLTSIVLGVDGVEVLIQQDHLLSVLFQILSLASGENTTISPFSETQVPLLLNLLDKIIQSHKDDPWKLKKEFLEKGVLFKVLAELSKITGLLPKNRDESNPFYPTFATKDKEKVSDENQKDELDKENTNESEEEEDEGVLDPSTENTYWAKGTGFGTGNMSDSKFSYKEYEEKSKEDTRILMGFLKFLSFFLDDDGSEVSKKIISLLYDSALQTVLESFLRNDSLFDMAKSIDLYQLLFVFLNKAIDTEALHPMLLDKNQSSIFSLLTQLQSISTIADKMPRSNKAKSDENEEVDEDESEAPGQLNMDNFIQSIKKTHTVFKSRLQEVKKSEEPVSEDGCEKEYIIALSEYQFDEIDMVKDKEYVHFYNDRIKSAKSGSKEKMRRIVQELSVLSSSAPIHTGSSIFVRVDTERMDVIKVLITGPTGTPYENGCFLFDVFLDNDYPNVPPQFNLMTTGKGAVRFNPNLYNCGKVCLSLLGTWRGGPNEGWNKESSTILQVLISIQSLIFVEEPYFNEPGYESSMGTESGIRESKSYNDVIKNATLKWAFLDMMQNPPLGFEEVVKIHFKLKKNSIRRQIKKWIEESEASSKLKQELKSTAEQVLKGLKKLE